MNTATAAAVFEIAPTQIACCADPLCMACAAGTCPAAKPYAPEIEEAGEAVLALVEAQYDAARAATPATDGPVVSALSRQGAAALVDALAALLDFEPAPAPQPPAPAPTPRPRVKRSPRPQIARAVVGIQAAISAYQPQAGDQVQRRSGKRNPGTVLEVHGSRVRVQWHAGQRMSGGAYDVSAWCEAGSLKPAGQMSDHAAWCRAEGKVLAELIAQACRSIAPLSGTVALYRAMGLSPEQGLEMFALTRGKVRGRAVYEQAARDLRAFIAGRLAQGATP